MENITELGIMLGTVFGAFGVILVGFYKYAQSREEQFSKDRDNSTKVMTDAIDRLGEHIEAGAKASQEVAKATKQAAKEAKERNGHLGEQNIKIADMIADLAVNLQTVEEQHVTHQTVEKQDKS